jgi:uncharacterized protein (TIGR01777 family)
VKIVIAGGTGFLGSALASRLAADRHDVVVLTRRSSAAPAAIRTVSWFPEGNKGNDGNGVNAAWTAEIDGAGAVVNLAGESIAGKRWSPAHKQQILDSRLRATRSLAAAIARASDPPRVFVSGSAVGYYGARGDEIVTEVTPPGADFLARVCVQWEAEASRAATAQTRVVCIRTGLVLERGGGALPAMLPPFKFGAGGPVGSGRQYWPWIHRTDWIDLVRWSIDTAAVSGPLNATAPGPVTNAEFARALGRALRRPSFMPAPGFALRLLLGEMADVLLLSGQRVVPAKAEALGFTFTYPQLDQALAAIFTAARRAG